MARFLLCMVLAELCFSSLALAAESNPRSGSASNRLTSESRITNRKFAGRMLIIQESSEPAEAPVYLDVEGPIGELKESHSKKHKHHIDPSIAGGAVILGGLATSLLIAIFCYIRVTKGKSTVKTLSDSGSSVYTPTKIAPKDSST